MPGFDKFLPIKCLEVVRMKGSCIVYLETE